MQNPRILLIIIMALFAAPLLLAVLMRTSWWDFTPAELSNRGMLVQPPVTLEIEKLEPLQGESPWTPGASWIVLFQLDKPCEMACRDALTGIRQVHLASGKHREKISLWLVFSEKPSPDEAGLVSGIYPEFELFVDPEAALDVATAQARAQIAGRTGSAAPAKTFVTDPAANIILAYDPGFAPGDLADDLDRLLTWSTQD